MSKNYTPQNRGLKKMSDNSNQNQTDINKVDTSTISQPPLEAAQSESSNNKPDAGNDQQHSAEKNIPTMSSTTSTNTDSEFDKLLDTVMKTGTIIEKSIVVTFSSYAEQMAPNKPVTAEKGARLNRTLLNSFISVLKDPKLTQDVVNSSLDIICAFIKEHRQTVFAETMFNRFGYMWPESAKKDYEEYTNLMYLFVTLHDPKTREQNKKQISFKALFNYLSDDLMKIRISNYFKV